ncbi:hypothetical protein GCM10009837_58430 [Streptomyces durmitorensis]|uniref:Uncharacterized protein n=1 Tax=Streptomyces durmitorensis TaxID=319947 RepID=A0ABY4PQQ9_9ACTN|nr:hypothetical protein [Streptomyces durmitorensis]UQT55931.1 hypothetical protein M4V62_12925 [Streptomyces durmitorensis]
MWAVQRKRRKQARKGDAWRWKSTVPLPGGRFRTAWTYTTPDEPEGAPRFSTRKNRLYVTRGRTLTLLPLEGSGPGDT